jgi:LacI family transcriptional regulator
MKNVTIQDVAKTAGVSAGTVDRVIHSRGGVSDKSLAAVKKAITFLNYENKDTEQLFTEVVNENQIFKIGICYPEVESHFWTDITNGIDAAETALSPLGLRIVKRIIPSHNVSSQLEAISKLINEDKVQALIFTPVSDNLSNTLDQIVPKTIPYATVIDDTIGTNRLFHIGPNNIPMGKLIAEYINFFSKGENENVVVISPKYDVSGAQERISGFLNKIKLESLKINVKKIEIIDEIEDKSVYDTVYETTEKIINENSDLNSIYITNGFGQCVAKAIKKNNKQDSIHVYCHEYNPGMEKYYDNDIIKVSIFQKPAQQWYAAINIMFKYLKYQIKPKSRFIKAECTVLTKGSIPLFCEDYMQYFK